MESIFNFLGIENTERNPSNASNPPPSISRSHEDWYKFCILGKEGDVKEIIIFSPDEENHFNEKENAYIESKSIPVRFSKGSIHPDDSIFTIKHNHHPQTHHYYQHHHHTFRAYIYSNGIKFNPM